MKKQGSIILGIGGDNSDSAMGECAMDQCAVGPGTRRNVALCFQEHFMREWSPKDSPPMPQMLSCRPTSSPPATANEK